MIGIVHVGAFNRMPSTIMFTPVQHHRRSIRLKNYDYSQPGAYFITMCAQDRQCAFGEIANGIMQTNAVGNIAATCWQQMPQHFHNTRLDAFVVMPNHIHGILFWLDNNAGVQRMGVHRRGVQLNAPTVNAHALDARVIIQPKQNAVNVIRHDDKRIQSRVVEMLRHLLPAGCRNISDSVCLHDAIRNLAERALPVLRAHRNEIRARLAVIVIFQPNRAAVMLNRSEHDC